jgi:hypothetical protein
LNRCCVNGERGDSGWRVEGRFGVLWAVVGLTVLPLSAVCADARQAQAGSQDVAGRHGPWAMGWVMGLMGIMGGNQRPGKSVRRSQGGPGRVPGANTAKWTRGDWRGSNNQGEAWTWKAALALSPLSDLLATGVFCTALVLHYEGTELTIDNFSSSCTIPLPAIDQAKPPKGV